MNILNHLNYREILKAEFLKKTNKNKSFSLRRFAQILEIQPSFLSEVLANKKNISESMALKISDKLSLSQIEKEYFFNLVQLERSKDPNLKEKIEQKIRELKISVLKTQDNLFYDLSVDQFKIISDWQHLAILKLLDSSEEPLSTNYLAKKIDLKVYDVELTLSRLQRLDLVEQVYEKGWIKIKHDVNIVSNIPNQALRKYHTQMLEKTITALSEQTPQERYTGTENLLLTKEQMLLANDIFEDAFKKILQLSKESKGNSLASLFHCGIHMIKLSKEIK